MNSQKNTSNHPFRVPEGYFEQMKEQVINKTRNSDTKRFSVIRSIRKNWMALAASLIILLGVAFGLWQNSAPKGVYLSNQLEVFYPESTNDLFDFIMEETYVYNSESEENLEGFDDFLLALEGIDNTTDSY
jgi:hypothetical protein